MIVTDATGTAANLRSYRLTNIDMLRGLVIIIMALDHCRDFIMTGGVPDPMGDPDLSVGLFLTRWVTHFCAPVFIFLAGTSVGLMSGRKPVREVAAFVFKRGLWLLFIEFTLLSTAYTFAPFGDSLNNGYTLMIFQVLWALGGAMVVLSGLLFLGPRICTIIGAVIVLGHNLLENVWPRGTLFGDSDPIWQSLYGQGSGVYGDYMTFMFYPLIPWIGVILLGFGTTHIFLKEPEERDKILLKTGLSFIAAFVAIRFLDMYGDPNPWISHEEGLLVTFFDFMNISKYPASLQFLLITLGPMAIVCSYADRLTGWLKDTLVMFGRVPFAFYVVHFYLIHSMSVVLGMIQGFEAHQFFHFFLFYPEGYGTGLLGVYISWAIVMVVLYPFCKWVDKIKSQKKYWWLSYL